MKIAYIVSSYPQISETFIAREMKQLIQFGNEISICKIKPVINKTTLFGIKVENAKVFNSQMTPLSWLLGLFWVLKNKSEPLRLIIGDLQTVPIFSKNFLKLLVIMITSFAMARKIDSTGVKHIRAHFLHSESICAMWISIILGVPFSLTIHTRAINFPENLIDKCLQKASFCVCISSNAKTFLESRPKKPQHCYIIRNSIDLNLFSDQVKKYTTEITFLLAIGRLIKKKGFDNLIYACKKLQADNFAFQCYIVGEGPEYKNLKRLVNSLQLQKTITFCGGLPFFKVQELFLKATVLVMPSRISPELNDFDGIPTVLIEAMASYVPVITTPVAGIPELVINRQTGMLVDTEDIEGFASVIKLIINDKNLRKKIILNARKKINIEYEIKTNTKLLLSLIHGSQ